MNERILFVTLPKPTLRGVFPDNGLALLSAILKKNHYEPRVLDLVTIEGLRYKDSWAEYVNEQIRKEIEDFNPSVVGFKAWINEFRNTLDAATETRDKFPEKKIILGGPQVDYFPEVLDDYLLDGTIDGYFEKEGEFLPRLLDVIDRKSEWNKIPNLTFNEKGNIVKTRTKFLPTLENLPFPDYSQDVYPSLSGDNKIMYINMRPNTGCSYAKCSFCFHPIKTGPYKSKSIDRIIEELRYYIDNYGFRVFRPSVSTTPPKMANSLAERLVEEDFGITYSMFGNILYGSQYDFEMLRKSGCVALFYGAESGEQKELDLIRKQITVEQTKDVVKRTLDSGIGAFLSMMYFGDEDAGKKSLDLVVELKPSGASWLPLMPMPKTDVALNPDRYNVVLEDDYFDKMAFYEVDLTKPLNEWQSMPYSVNGKNGLELLTDTMKLTMAAEKAGITTRVSDETYVLAGMAGLGLEEMRDSEELFRRDDYEGTKELVGRMNGNVSVSGKDSGSHT